MRRNPWLIQHEIISQKPLYKPILTSILDFAFPCLLAFAHFQYQIFIWNHEDKAAEVPTTCKCQNRGTFWPCRFQLGMDDGTTNPRLENLGSEGIMNTLVLLILVITSSLAAIKQRALQSELSPAKMMDAMLFLLIKHCMHIPQVNIHRKHRQLCLFLKETKGRSFGSNARLLSLGIIFTGCSCRWWNIHLSSAKNFSNNPVLMSAQGPGRIQPNLN